MSYPQTHVLQFVVALLVSGGLLPSASRAAQVSFAWDYDDPRAAGFMLYCGGNRSGLYDAFRLDVGNMTGVTVSGLAERVQYFCAVTAYRPGEESAFSDEVAVIPDAPPNPVFTMSATSGRAPLSVSFRAATAAASGPVTRWLWDFGDGSTSTEQTATHVYTTPGRYTVALTASGPGGSVSKTASVSSNGTTPTPTPITVRSANSIMNAVRAALGAVLVTPPATDFTISNAEGTAPFSVTFTNTTLSGSSWNWDFGDGATSTEHSPTHTYYRAGTYTVRLDASGPGGTVSKSATDAITVAAAPVAAVEAGCASGASREVLFGDVTTGTPDKSPIGVASAFQATAANCGKVGSLNVYLHSGLTATKVVVGFYSDWNGHPYALLAQGSTTSPIAGDWNAITIPPTKVDAGAVYWIAILVLGPQDQSANIHTSAGNCATERFAQTGLSGLPSIWITEPNSVGIACLSAYGVATQ